MASSQASGATGYYDGPELDELIFGALDAAGLDARPLDIDALAPLDEFHAQGRVATAALAELSDLRPGIRLLDVGAGIGGPARYLAARHGAQVTAVDATARFCRVAERLNEACGLDRAVEVHCADATALPFPDASFDRAWSQALIQNVPDKAALLAELRRALCCGGSFSMFEVLSRGGQEIHFPVPWGDGPQDSFLVEGAQLRELAEGAGFSVREWHPGVEALARIAAAAGAEPAAPEKAGPGLELLMPDYEERMAGVARNIVEGRIELVMAVLVAE
ncbi:MAG TPA: class I SAM-dependent methyltransferase [Solirubrobacteraceae bacterium]|nr:class I SAM-dependent methyltransferase [Solirubrobacteraceae bacterium]